MKEFCLDKNISASLDVCLKFIIYTFHAKIFLKELNFTFNKTAKTCLIVSIFMYILIIISSTKHISDIICLIYSQIASKKETERGKTLK